MKKKVKKNNKTKIIIIFVVLVILALWSFIFFPSKPASPNNYDNFSICLTQNNAKMYGAYWCPHCQNQKDMFGSSWKYVNYVECDNNGQQAAICTQAGVRGYPTWTFNDKIEREGELTFTDLSTYSGCPLSLIE